MINFSVDKAQFAVDEVFSPGSTNPVESREIQRRFNKLERALIATYAIDKFVLINSLDEIPYENIINQNKSGYILNGDLIVRVGTGGNLLDGKYQNLGHFGIIDSTGLEQVWDSLVGNNDTYKDYKISANHLPEIVSRDEVNQIVSDGLSNAQVPEGVLTEMVANQKYATILDAANALSKANEASRTAGAAEADITSHKANTDIHLSAEDKNLLSSINRIDFSSFASSKDLSHHVRNTEVHVTAEEKARWNSNSNSGSATTAQRLETPVSLWGQSFDGSASVSGDLSDVGSIRPLTGKSLGTSSSRWDSIFGSSIDASGTIHASTGIYTEGYVSTRTASTSSDERLKTNIKPLEDCLDYILNTNFVSFNWKENNAPSVGIIAQEELRRKFGFLVEKNGEYYSYQYAVLTAILGQALKEEHAKVKELEERIAALEGVNRKLG